MPRDRDGSFEPAIVVKVRDGQVANRPIYVAISVTADGERGRRLMARKVVPAVTLVVGQSRRSGQRGEQLC